MIKMIIIYIYYRGVMECLPEDKLAPIQVGFKIYFNGINYNQVIISFNELRVVGNCKVTILKSVYRPKLQNINKVIDVEFRYVIIIVFIDRFLLYIINNNNNQSASY